MPSDWAKRQDDKLKAKIREVEEKRKKAREKRHALVTQNGKVLIDKDGRYHNE